MNYASIKQHKWLMILDKKYGKDDDIVKEMMLYKFIKDLYGKDVRANIKIQFNYKHRPILVTLFKKGDTHRISQPIISLNEIEEIDKEAGIC